MRAPRPAALLSLIVAIAGTVLAGEQSKARAPEDAIVLLKTAWESGDDEAIVARYAEPDASFVHTALVIARRIDAAAARIERLTREKLGPVVASELAHIDTRATSPLVGARFEGGRPFVDPPAIVGSRATARIHLVTQDGVREIPCALVHVGGEWKLRLVSHEGDVLGEADRARLAATTAASERTATALEGLALDLAQGRVKRRDDLRKALARISERERASLARIATDAARRREKTDSSEKAGLDRDD